MIRGNPQRGLWGATLGYFIGFAAVSLFGPMSKFFETAVGLSPVMAGLLVSIPSFSGSLLRIPFAAWVDSTGGKKPIVVLLSIALAGMTAIAVMLRQPVEFLQNNFFLLLFFGVLAGSGIATFSVGIGQTSYWFPQKGQGRALGIYAGVGSVAPGLFALLLTNVLIPLLSLENTYALWAGFLILGTILYIGISRNAWYFQYLKQGKSPQEAKTLAQKDGQEIFPSGSAMQSLKISSTHWQTWVLALIYFLGFGGFLALTGWSTKYWQSFHGLSLKTAGWLTMMYSVGSSLTRILGGMLADRIGGLRTINIFLVLTLAGSVLMFFAQGMATALTGIILMAIGMGMVNGGVFKLVPHFVPRAIGGAAGWVGGMGAFGGFVIPIVMSLFLDGSAGDKGYSQGFSIFFFLTLLAFLAVFILKRSRPMPASSSEEQTK